jgi:hypothetical protein
MKSSSYLIMLLVICLGSCFVNADQVNASANTSLVPVLTGNWNGTSEGYSWQEGFYAEDYPIDFSLSINKQNDRIFNGSILMTADNYTNTYYFSGIIANDMKTLYMTENGTGHDIGLLKSPTEIELIGLDNEGNSALVELKKQ